MSVVWDRHFGYLNKMLAAPISWAAISMGKMLAVAIQSVIQVTIITIISTFSASLRLQSVAGSIAAVSALYCLTGVGIRVNPKAVAKFKHKLN